jgi:hypothetical protein
MKIARIMACGAILLQSAGCTTAEFLVFLQTIFLGVTAAGAVAIIQNV